jgi:hypothetical protein
MSAMMQNASNISDTNFWVTSVLTKTLLAYNLTNTGTITPDKKLYDWVKRTWQPI